MKKKIIIPTVIIAMTGVGIGAFFGIKAVYQSGIEAGRSEAYNETKENVENLSTAMDDKINFQQKINEALGNTPTEINADSINSYINSLETLVNETANANAKEALETYLSKWREFSNTYASQDNSAIDASFNDLKTTSLDTAAKIKTIYDQAINSAIDNL